MSYDDLRGVTTLFALIAFISVVLWAWSGRQKKSFDEAANVLFDDEEEKMHLNSLTEAKNHE